MQITHKYLIILLHQKIVFMIKIQWVQCSTRLAAYTTPPPQKVKVSSCYTNAHCKQDDMYKKQLNLKSRFQNGKVATQ